MLLEGREEEWTSERVSQRRPKRKTGDGEGYANVRLLRSLGSLDFLLPLRSLSSSSGVCLSLPSLTRTTTATMADHRTGLLNQMYVVASVCVRLCRVVRVVFSACKYLRISSVPHMCSCAHVHRVSIAIGMLLARRIRLRRACWFTPKWPRTLPSATCVPLSDGVCCKQAGRQEKRASERLPAMCVLARWC